MPSELQKVPYYVIPSLIAKSEKSTMTCLGYLFHVLEALQHQTVFSQTKSCKEQTNELTNQDQTI